MPQTGLNEITELRPQAGPQTDFLSSAADIVVYGGAAGGGKSWGLLLEPLRHIEKHNFGGVIFRRIREEVTNEGGLWDEAGDIYPLLGAAPNSSDLYYRFPTGATIGFAGLQHETDVTKWQGSQIAFLGFDELTHFTEYQFFYMLSRNRSKSAVRSYVRATCNPDAESWVAGFIAYWIDQATGFADPEKAGVIRWLVRNNNNNYWFDTEADASEYAREAFPYLVEKFGPRAFAKSVTFIPADVFDNPALLNNDPGYLASLLALPLIERERLLRGNWKIKASAGKVYNREWFEIVDAIGTGGIDVRFWDLAATEKKVKQTAKHDPDYTATVKMRYLNGIWTITDAYQIQTAAANVEKLVFQVAELDYHESRVNKSRYMLRWEVEPGSAGKREAQRWITKLGQTIRGLDARGVSSREDKLQRALGCSAQAEAGNVKILRGPWNNMLLTHLHGFPDYGHDDLFDATSGAYNATDEGGVIITG